MRRFILAFALAATPTPALAQAGVPDELPGLENAPPFVAEVVVSNAQVKNQAYTMYYIPGRMRLESSGPTPDGSKQVIISWLTDNVSFVDIGGQWFKIRNDALGAENLQYGATSGFKTLKLGKETMDGKLCDHLRFISPDGSTKVDQWMWGEYPIKAVVNNKMGTTTAFYKSLRAQTTPASYFVVPRGEKIQDLDAMGGMGGMAGGAGAQGADMQQMLKQLQGQ